MPRNAIQFQKGLSDAEFERLYGTEILCIEALEAMRWPNGFVCPACDYNQGCRLAHRRLMQCNACHAQTSITAGTIFHATKLPLVTWFRGIRHLTVSKNGISAMELMRRLGIAYNSAWLMKHKLMQVMKEREAGKRLERRVEMDDVYLGGERARTPGKSGRGAEGKVPFLAAVETDGDGRPQRIAMQVVDGFTKEEVKAFALAKLAPSCEIISDGLSCFASVVDAGCEHTYIVCGGGRKAVERPAFKWVNTTLGNIKSALTGTYRHIDLKHAPRYLAEFQYRYNRRNDLAGMLGRLVWVSLRTPPFPYRLVKLGESHA